jgi:hypothetical protein
MSFSVPCLLFRLCLVVREGVGVGGEMTQVLYAHMNNKRKKINKKKEGAKSDRREIEGNVTIKLSV